MNTALVDFFKSNSAMWEVVFDVGANIGVTTSLFKKIAPHTKIYSFEPGVDTFKFLTETLNANNIKAEVFNIGLGATSGRVKFHESTMLAGSHVVHDDYAFPDVGNREIEIRTIDEVVDSIGLSRLDLIKIDVEGLDIDVLRGAEQTLKRFKPKVFIEFNSYALVAIANCNPRSALSYLKDVFDQVLRFKDGEWVRINSSYEDLAFIYANMVLNNCVDDLICQFD